MNETKRKVVNIKRRALRVRATVHGTALRPRLAVRVTNKHVSAQIINDETHATLVSATSVGKKDTVSLTKKAELVATDIAAKAKTAKIKKVVLDRGSKLYHGRVKVFADKARSKGLEF